METKPSVSIMHETTGSSTMAAGALDWWVQHLTSIILSISGRPFVNQMAWEHLQATEKHGGGSLQVCISANRVWDLVRINGVSAPRRLERAYQPSSFKNHTQILAIDRHWAMLHVHVVECVNTKLYKAWLKMQGGRKEYQQQQKNQHFVDFECTVVGECSKVWVVCACSQVSLECCRNFGHERHFTAARCRLLFALSHVHHNHHYLPPSSLIP